MRRRAAKLRAALLSGPVPAKELDGRARLWENVVRAPPSGTWERRRADHYALAEQWVGPGAVSEADGHRPSHPLVPPRLRPGGARGRLVLGRRPGSTARPRARATTAAPLPRRTGPRAARSPPCSAAAGRHAGAGPLPALVGRGPARPRAPHGHPAGGVPPDRLRQQEPAVRARPSSSTVASRARGATTTGASSSSPTSGCRAPALRELRTEGEPTGRLHERRRMSVTPSRNGSNTLTTRSSPRTCSLKATISGREPSTARPPDSVLSAAIRPRSESRGNTAS